MTASRDPDRLIRAFFEEGPDELPDPVYDAVRDRIEQTPQRADRGPWRTFLMSKTMQYGLAAAAVILAIIGFQTLAAGPTPGGSPSAQPSATATAPSSTADYGVDAFLAARVAGEGAEQYLSDPDAEVPLLYGTTSGSPYDRAEFEPVVGIEWPYGWLAFKVRLFAGDTVVEQLIFKGRDGPPWLEYQPDGFGTEIAPTTENGQALAMPYTYFDGQLTLHAAHPWIFHDGWAGGRLIPEGPGVPPTTDGGERNDWDGLVLMADPALAGPGCQADQEIANAAALAEAIRSNPDLGATAPVAVRVGEAEGLMMDVVIAAGATITVPADAQGNVCSNAFLSFVLEQSAVGSSISVANGVATGQATGDWMRLYLFDVPEGSSMRILAIAIVAPESRFERAVDAAAPIVDSVEFNVP